MFENMKNLLQRSRDHKELMLVGLYFTLIAVYTVFSGVAVYQKLFTVFFAKYAVVLFSSLSLFYYLKSHNTRLYAVLFVIIVDIDIALSILGDQTSTYSTPYPFIVVFVFFFFFKLKTALIATTLHYIFWILMTVYGQYLYPQGHHIFALLPNLNTFVTSFLVVTLSLLYHLSTEISYQQLEHSNRQNEILLKEIHHRIKNNLNVIASILGLQIMQLKRENKEDQKDVLLKSRLRIEAIAMVHEALYRSEDLEKIDFKTYVQHLCDAISKTYNKKLHVQIDSEKIFLSLETMLQLGIIINELVTNSIKHAIEENSDVNDKITIRLAKERNNCILTYHEKSDKTVDIHKLESSKTLGMRLIKLSVKQMDSVLEIFQKDGLLFSIIFSCKQ